MGGWLRYFLKVFTFSPILFSQLVHCFQSKATLPLCQAIFINPYEAARHSCTFDIPEWVGRPLSFWEHAARKFLLVPLRIRNESLTPWALDFGWHRTWSVCCHSGIVFSLWLETSRVPRTGLQDLVTLPFPAQLSLSCTHRTKDTSNR